MSLFKQPKTKRGEETLRRICAASETLFAERGFYDTQISDIARRAGVAAGTIYIYFPDKLSIFRYLLESLGHELRKETHIATIECRTMAETEEKGLYTFFQFITRHKGLFEIVWQAQFVDKSSFKYYYERFSAGYVGTIERAQASGEIPMIYDPACLSYCLMGVYNFVALKCFVFDGAQPTEEEIRSVIRFVRFGFASREAAEPPEEKKPE